MLHTDRHAKAQGRVEVFFGFYGTLKTPNLYHKNGKRAVWIALNCICTGSREIVINNRKIKPHKI